MRKVLVAGSIVLSCLALSGSAAAQGASPAPVDGATYNVRLRDVQSRIDELKANIRASQGALRAIADVTMGSTDASQVELTFRNEMSGAFRLRSALFLLDGVVQLNKSNDPQLADEPTLPIFQGPLSQGDHTVQVVLDYQGSGQGVLTYMRAYRFELRSGHSFTTNGRPVEIVARGVEKGGPTTPFELRPGLVWSEKVAPREER